MLILASASPRRRELLGKMGLEFEVVPPEADEVVPPGLKNPREAALHLASEKGREVARLRPHDWVLAADTIVTLGAEILGKPRDGADALLMLQKLSGRAHLVITAFCLLNASLGREHLEAVETKVFFHEVPEKVLAAYAASPEPLDKAGAYAIQGGAAGFVKRIEGSCSNVVGLPVERLSEVLRQEGIFSAPWGR
ncbi:MAG: Maf family protein [Pseudomonadota bacterium]